MTENPTTSPRSRPETPAGWSTVNPVVVTPDADRLLAFIADVFGGVENPEAHTYDTDGLLIHAEMEIGGTTLTVAERKPDWPFTPALLQVYVDDVPATLARGVARGARVVTEPTNLFGTTFLRMVDPWHDVWWVYRHGELDWSTGEGQTWDEHGGTEEWTSPELAYMQRTLDDFMPGLGRD